MSTDSIINIKDMTCVACENKIQNRLSQINGVEKVTVSFNTGIVCVRYDDKVISLVQINEAVVRLGYTLGKKQKRDWLLITYLGVSLLLVISLVLIKVFTNWGILSLVSYWDKGENISAGILVVALVMGLISSLHCIFMCGSFTLARNIKQLESTNDHNKKFEWKKFKDSVFYNAGRIISYTLMGIIFGAIGQSFSLLDSSVVSGIFFILIAVLMFIIGLNLTGFFPELKKFNPRLPKKLSNLINKAKGKVDFGFVHGLFTCLMPCGPLYAMYAIASGSGSWYMGGLVMLVFAIGTLPLMLGMGILTKFIGKKSAKVMMIVGSTIIVFLAIIMLTTGIFNFGMGVKLWQ